MRLTALLLLLTLSPISSAGLERETSAVYRQRREALAAKHGDGVILLLGYGQDEAQSARSPFRQENNFYYLTGWNEPGAALLLVPAESEGRHPREFFFLPPDDPATEQWQGARAAPGDAGIEDLTGFAKVLPRSDLQARLRKETKGRSHVYTLFPGLQSEGQQPEPDRREEVQAYAGDLELADIREDVEDLRAIKSEGELRLIQKAVDASAAAHRAAWGAIKPGWFEYQIMGTMLSTMVDRGCLRPAYTPIIGSGPNSTVLHYSAGTRRLESGDLVVIDVGGEYAQYAADLTRTVPVDGKFTPRQREIYDLVLAVQEKVIAAVKPGATLHGLSRMARTLFDEMGPDAAGKKMGEYFFHGVGHSVGLRVHDPIDFSQPLKAGMVITIEPGLYLADEELGVRIEDMLVVTADGARLLSEALPKDAETIEAEMRAP